MKSREESKAMKGWSLGVGAATLLTPALRVGVSAENLANSKVADFSPRTIRAGAAYIFSNGNLTAHLDYRHRERVAALESKLVEVDGLLLSEALVNSEESKKLTPEQMLIASCSARVYDLLRLLGAYGASLEGERQLMAGGLALVNNNFSISYTVSRPDFRSQKSHQAVNLGFSMAM